MYFPNTEFVLMLDMEVTFLFVLASWPSLGILLCRSHEHLHGNTKLELATEDAMRVSLVMYCNASVCKKKISLERKEEIDQELRKHALGVPVTFGTNQLEPASVQPIWEGSSSVDGPQVEYYENMIPNLFNWDTRSYEREKMDIRGQGGDLHVWQV